MATHEDISSIQADATPRIICSSPGTILTLSSQRLVLNVGGRPFETTAGTLSKFPGTRLGELARKLEQDESYDLKHEEFFFDRNSDCFTNILDYYRTDELHIDQKVCGNVMKKELAYWRLCESDIEPCCWGNYSKYLNHKETLAQLDDTFGVDPEEEAGEAELDLSTWVRVRKKLWLTLEYPSTSRLAKVYMAASLTFVIASIITFTLETHYWFRVTIVNGTTLTAPDPDLYYGSTSGGCYCDELRNPSEMPDSAPHPVLEYVDVGCLAFFVLEFVLRIATTPKYIKFLKSPLNIIDIFCLIPHCVAVVMRLTDKNSDAPAILRLVTLLRAVRVLRVFKLMKHYAAFRILAYTIKVSSKELILMVAFLITGVVIFASVIHYVESDNFTSIPIAFWWALVTMTTVGYGDKYPKEPAGYVIGSICVMCGVLVIAFTVPIVVNNFTLYYSHTQSRSKLNIKPRGSHSRSPRLTSVFPLDGSGSMCTLASARSTDTNNEGVSPRSTHTLIPQATARHERKRLNVSASSRVFLHKRTVEDEQAPGHRVEARELVDDYERLHRDFEEEQKRQYQASMVHRKGARSDENTLNDTELEEFEEFEMNDLGGYPGFDEGKERLHQDSSGHKEIIPRVCNQHDTELQEFDETEMNNLSLR